nr:unnamed protein product [Digitaria exilis]CAB3455644.1 unnamed protein product [Digitaria exilis]
MAPPQSYAYSSIDANDDDDDDVTTVRCASPPEVLTVSTVASATVGVGHHMFKVEGYSRLKCTHGVTVGSYLNSGEFEAGGHAWRILCYLNGARAEDAGFVSFFLVRVDDEDAAGSVAIAEVELELLHHAGEVVRWPSSRVGRFPARRFRVGSGWGWPRFIAVEELERSSWFLKDDGFAVRCTITVVEEELVVEEEDVEEEDLERMGMVCACEDDSS